jgi:hypothetical protein
VNHEKSGSFPRNFTLIKEPPMSPAPLVLGLTLCEKAIVEEGPKNMTLVSTFTKLVVDEFPSLPQKLVLYAVLTGGLGDGTIHLVVRHLDTNDEIFTAEMPVRFPDRVAEVRVLLRINRCSFPAAGNIFAHSCPTTNG